MTGSANGPLVEIPDAADRTTCAASELTASSSDPVPVGGFRETIHAVVVDSVQYLLGLALLSLANIALVPLYTRRLSPSEFGIYALIDVTVLGILTVSSLGLNVAYLKWFSKIKANETSALFSEMLIAGSAAALVLGLVFFLIVRGEWGTRWLGITTNGFAWMLFPIVLAETLENLLLAHLRALRRPVAFCGASAARLVAMVAFSIWYLGVRHLGLTGVFLGRLAGDVAGIAVLIVLCSGAFRWSFSRERILGMVHFGLPLVFSALMATLLDVSGRYFLNHYGSYTEVGLYSLGSKLSGLVRVFLVAPFGAAWGGVMFQIAKVKNARIIYSKVLSYVFLLAIVAAVVTDLFTPALLKIFATPAYFEARRVVPLLLLMQAVVMMQYPMSVGIYLKGSTKVFTLLYGGSLLLDLAMNRLLVPRFGMIGAALTLLTAWAALVGGTAIVSQRHYALDYEARPFLLGGLICSVVFLFQKTGITNSAGNLVYVSIFALLITFTVLWYVVWDFRSTSTRLEGLGFSPQGAEEAK
jgi:O-antigen/teichoic acid export membrane protein